MTSPHRNCNANFLTAGLKLKTRAFAKTAALAATLKATYVNFYGRLGKREVRRAQAGLVTAQELQRKLFDCGFEVEELIETGKDISGVVTEGSVKGKYEGRRRVFTSSPKIFFANTSSIPFRSQSVSVLEGFGINPDEYTGFAFGMGIERIAMLKYGINNMKLLFEGDTRFLKQFKD